MTLAVGTHISSYDVEELIGEGVLGEVYRVRHRLLGRVRAMKVVRDTLGFTREDLHDFQRAIVATAVGDSRVLEIHDAGVIETGPQAGRAFVVTPLIVGTLADRLTGPLPIDDAVGIARVAAAALEALHKRDVVHRGIKPSNVVLDARGAMLLADAGWGVLGTVARDGSNGVSGALPMTYGAPEQFASPSRPTKACDVYALGCVLFEMLSGVPPFRGRPEEVIGGHLHVPAPSIRATRPDVSAAIDALLARMLAKDPDQRPTAGELARSLVTVFAPADATERELFETLRARADAATREVYADWLEQHGHPDRAVYLRAPVELIQLSPAIDPRWRAAVAQGPVSRCTVRLGAGCDMAWDALDRTDNDQVRHCARCAKPVYFCSTLDEAIDHGRNRECIALDRAMLQAPVLEHYDRSRAPSVDWVGDIAPDIVPEAMPPHPNVVTMPYAPTPPDASPPSLLSRLRRLFRR